MKIILYLGLVITIVAVGECLQCHHCYEGSTIRNDQLLGLISEYQTQIPNQRCSKNSGEMSGPFCDKAHKCVHMDVDSDNEKAVYRFCSYIDNIETTRTYNQYYNQRQYMKANFNFCSRNLCNSASSIFTATSLIVVLALTSFFA